MEYLKKISPIIYFFCVVSGNSENFDSQIFKLSSQIATNYFKIFKCLTIITDIEPDVISISKPVFVIKMNDDEDKLKLLLIESYQQGCGGFIIRIGPEKRSDIVKNLISGKNRAETFRYNRERYLFLPKDTNDTDISVLDDSQLFFLPNFLLITPIDDNFYLYTHTIFDPGVEDIYKLVDIYSVGEGFKWNRNLYPDKIKNIKGKEIILGLFQYLPYSLIVNGSDEVIYDGLDVRLVDEFSKTINGTWGAIDHPEYLWGTKFPNGSGNGVFGSVKSHKVDIGLGGFYQWYCDILDCSYPYIQSDVTCLVPKPQILSGWLTILLPFTISTWIGLVVAFFIALIFVFGIIMAEMYLRDMNPSKEITATASKSLYTIFRLQIQQIPKSAHKNNPLATYIKISIFYYFIVSVFWQGGIASILTVPRYEAPINSPYDLVQRWPKVEWGAIHRAWANSIENSTDPVLHQIVTKFVVLDKENLIRRTRTRDFAFLIEMMQNGHYGFNDYLNETSIPYLRLMEKSLYSAFGVVILPRGGSSPHGSPYTEKLDNVIHWFYATGIIQKIEVQVSLERVDNHLQNMIRFSNEKDKVQVILGLRHIEGAVYIYFAGVALSTLSFFGEKIIFRRKQKLLKEAKQNGKYTP